LIVWPSETCLEKPRFARPLLLIDDAATYSPTASSHPISDVLANSKRTAMSLRIVKDPAAMAGQASARHDLAA
jgi:hypothetical protein